MGFHQIQSDLFKKVDLNSKNDIKLQCPNPFSYLLFDIKEFSTDFPNLTLHSLKWSWAGVRNIWANFICNGK